VGQDEQILVVPRIDLFWNGPFRGVSTTGLDHYLDRVRRHGFFKRRGDVEEDPSLKQVIPYLLVRRAGRYMLFRRTRAGGEARLHDLYSLGVGGHIAKGDVATADGSVASDVVAAGLRRELDEELVVTGAWSARLAGVLNDDGNPVGQVHFGLVHVVDVASGDVTIREIDRLTGRLADLDEIRGAYPQMETWSQFIVDAGILNG
jgi:predicted NUDIX family phosphoesterase